MGTLGLIAAMPQESNALSRYIKGWKGVKLGSFTGKRFELSGQMCILVTSGMGIRRASEAARVLIEICTPGLLISFGIAGAVEADLKIGDVVAIQAFGRLEDEVLSSVMSLEHWPDSVVKAASKVLARRGARLFSGTAVTTRGTQVLKNQLNELEHPVLEMETAGIAAVAAEKGIPLLSLRAISDGPRAPLPFDLNETMDDDANVRIDRIVKTLVRRPKIVLQLKGLMQNSAIAADNAAVAILAAINQLTI